MNLNPLEEALLSLISGHCMSDHELKDAVNSAILHLEDDGLIVHTEHWGPTDLGLKALGIEKDFNG